MTYSTRHNFLNSLIMIPSFPLFAAPFPMLSLFAYPDADYPDADPD